MTHETVNVWHVFADGQWHAIQYDGYAPVSAEVGGRLVPIDYRHLATGCTRTDCA